MKCPLVLYNIYHCAAGDQDKFNKYFLSVVIDEREGFELDSWGEILYDFNKINKKKIILHLEPYLRLSEEIE